MADMSLRPIDCGFDPRRHGMACVIPEGTTSVDYSGTSGDDRTVTGTRRAIVLALRKAGYAIADSTLREHLSRAGKAGTGAAKRRSPEQYAAIQERALATRRHAKDYVAERPGGWGVLRWDETRQIHVEGPVYPTKRQALEILRGE